MSKTACAGYPSQPYPHFHRTREQVMIVPVCQKTYRCVVKDNGPGIPDDMKDKLFHRSSHGATKAHGKGPGLYIVRTLVEGYGRNV